MLSVVAIGGKSLADPVHDIYMIFKLRRLILKPTLTRKEKIVKIAQCWGLKRSWFFTKNLHFPRQINVITFPHCVSASISRKFCFVRPNEVMKISWNRQTSNKYSKIHHYLNLDLSCIQYHPGVRIKFFEFTWHRLINFLSWISPKKVLSRAIVLI